MIVSLTIVSHILICIHYVYSLHKRVMIIRVLFTASAWMPWTNMEVESEVSKKTSFHCLSTSSKIYTPVHYSFWGFNVKKVCIYLSNSETVTVSLINLKIVSKTFSYFFQLKHQVCKLRMNSCPFYIPQQMFI